MEESLKSINSGLGHGVIKVSASTIPEESTGTVFRTMTEAEVVEGKYSYTAPCRKCFAKSNT